MSLDELVRAIVREELAAAEAKAAGAPPRLLDVDAARAALGGISRPTIYALIQSGKLRTIKVSRRRFVPESAIAEYLGTGSAA